MRSELRQVVGQRPQPVAPLPLDGQVEFGDAILGALEPLAGQERVGRAVLVLLEQRA